jgi:D-psicose/D-tagatose/L-ribulose 3-epimerase
MEAGQSLTNLHVADSNRGALGDGSIDLDVIIMALYLLDYNQDGKYVTAEPLGPGGDPYPAMYGIPEKAKLDSLVQKSIDYFREREYALVG